MGIAAIGVVLPNSEQGKKACRALQKIQLGTPSRAPRRDLMSRMIRQIRCFCHVADATWPATLQLGTELQRGLVLDNPTVYWPSAVWSILATSGEGRLSLLPARPEAASSSDTPRSSLMATSAP
jgi:hypothetical protein